MLLIEDLNSDIKNIRVPFIIHFILLKISIVYLGYYNDLKRWSDHGNTKDLKLHHTLFVIYIRKCKYKDHEKVKYELCQPFSPVY
jgi:hypothetical protein